MADDDPVTARLNAAPASDAVRQAAAAAFRSAATTDDLVSKIDQLALPKEVKSALWQMKRQEMLQKQQPKDYGYGNRWDEASQSYAGAPKGLGFLGPLKTASGDPMTELSIDGTINGRPTQYPAIVPTLTKDELSALMNRKESDPIPDTIKQKAVVNASQRIQQGKSPFAEEGEQANLYPDLPRVDAAGRAPMNFAVVNGRRVPLTDDMPDDIKQQLREVDKQQGGSDMLLANIPAAAKAAVTSVFQRPLEAARGAVDRTLATPPGIPVMAVSPRTGQRYQSTTGTGAVDALKGITRGAGNAVIDQAEGVTSPVGILSEGVGTKFGNRVLDAADTAAGVTEDAMRAGTQAATKGTGQALSATGGVVRGVVDSARDVPLLAALTNHPYVATLTAGAKLAGRGMEMLGDYMSGAVAKAAAMLTDADKALIGKLENLPGWTTEKATEAVVQKKAAQILAEKPELAAAAAGKKGAVVEPDLPSPSANRTDTGQQPGFPVSDQPLPFTGPAPQAQRTGTPMQPGFPVSDQPLHYAVDAPPPRVVPPQAQRSGTPMQPGFPVSDQPVQYNTVNAPPSSPPPPPPPAPVVRPNTTSTAMRPTVPVSNQPLQYNRVTVPAATEAAGAAPAAAVAGTNGEIPLSVKLPGEPLAPGYGPRAATPAPTPKTPVTTGTKAALIPEADARRAAALGNTGTAPPEHELALRATRHMSSTEITEAASDFDAAQNAQVKTLKQAGITNPYQRNRIVYADTLPPDQFAQQALKNGGLNEATVKSLVAKFDKPTVAKALKTLGAGAYQSYKRFVQ